MQVGGAAALGEDFLLSQSDRIPWAVGTTLLASAIILFLLFGSLAIPIKAVIMTLLSLTASFGALVWIFERPPAGWTLLVVAVLAQSLALLVGDLEQSAGRQPSHQNGRARIGSKQA